MRYPDALQSRVGIKVPSEMYTQSDAEEVMEYARRILEHVKAKISNPWKRLQMCPENYRDFMKLYYIPVYYN